MRYKSVLRMLLCVCALALCLTGAALASETGWNGIYAPSGDANLTQTLLADLDFDGVPEMLCLYGDSLTLKRIERDALKTAALGSIGENVESVSLDLRLRAGYGYAWIMRIRCAASNTGAAFAEKTVRLVYAGGTLKFADIYEIRNASSGGASFYYASGKRVSSSAYARSLRNYNKKWASRNVIAPSAKDYSASLASQYEATVSYKPIYPSKLSLKKTSVSVALGGQYPLAWSFKPSYATARTVTWTSLDESIATVDAYGVVTGTGYGATSVVGKTSNGKAAKCTVKVPRPAAQSVSVASASGESAVTMKFKLQLGATVYPEGSVQAVTWTTSKSSVAKVSKTGLVTGVKAGTAIITAKTANGKRGSFTVTVTKPVLVTTVALDNQYIDIAAGGEARLSATVYPLNATYPALTWKSANKAVATVDQNGVITGVSEGQTAVSAATSNGVSAHCIVAVSATGVVTRRALVIGTGNSEYLGTSGINDEAQKENEAKHIAAMLKNLAFHGDPISVTTLTNPTRASDALAKIRSTFAKADADDVNYLYIVCHGSNPALRTYTLALGHNGSYITGKELRATLDALSGTFVIIVESCYSGDLIGKGEAAGIESFVEDFAAAGLTGKSGEMADEKYRVICSSTSYQTSSFYWADATHNMSFFGYAVSLAGGWDPGILLTSSSTQPTAQTVPLAADKNGDDSVTLAELYNYTSARVKQYSGGKQTVVCYPQSSGAVIFHRS